MSFRAVGTKYKDGHAHGQLDISRRSSLHWNPYLLLTNVAELYSLPEISDNANPLDIGRGNIRLVKTTALQHGTSSIPLQDNRAHEPFQTKRTRKVGVTGKYGTVRTSHP